MRENQGLRMDRVIKEKNLTASETQEFNTVQWNYMNICVLCWSSAKTGKNVMTDYVI